MRIVFTGMLCLAIFVISASGRGLRTSADSSVLDPPNGLKSNKPVVVTQAFCRSIFASIKSKTQPYWDVEAQKCNVETRTELVEQCSVIIAEFRKQLADVCPPMEPCTENCNKFKPVKYLAKKATLPNNKFAAFPEPADDAASRRMAEAQKAVPMPIICKVPPCPQRDAPKESTTTTTSAGANAAKSTPKPVQAVPVQPVVAPEAKPAAPPTPAELAEKQNVMQVLVATPNK